MTDTLVRHALQPFAAVALLADESRDGVAVVLDGRLAYANPALVRRLGATRAEDLQGRRLLDFVPACRQAEWERLLCDALAADFEPLPARLAVRRLDGSEAACSVLAACARLGARRGVQLVFRGSTAA